MTQFYSRIDTKFNGDVYNIPFSYISKDDINVYINDELFTNWYFLNESQIKLIEIPSDLPVESIVSIRRNTPIDNKIVTYTNRSMLEENNLNLSQTQVLNSVQEIYDNNVQFEIDIDNKLTEVNEAARLIKDTLETVDQAVETSEQQAQIATDKATEATEKLEALNEAYESAISGLTTNKDSILSSIETASLEVLENIQEKEAEIENTLEGVETLVTLEICDIGMSLYVDESKGLRRYLNGQIVDLNENTKQFFDKLQKIQTLHPSLFDTEENWQAAKTLSAFRQVGKFVFNYADDGVTIESVRLPRVVNVQGLFDLSNLGMTVSAGLPNIKGQFKNSDYAEPSGANYIVSQYSVGASGGIAGHPGTHGGTYYYIGIDASKSSSIYGASSTVQEEAIQYPYFIQIATGVETENNIVNEIELNNPFSFGDSKYSPIELNNISWLKSEGQWNSKALYPDFYNWVLENVNKGEKYFVSTTRMYAFSTDNALHYYIAATTPIVGMAVYNQYGVFRGHIETVIDDTTFVFTSNVGGTLTVTRNSSEDNLWNISQVEDYTFCINTADETFRLPLLDGSEDLPSDRFDRLTFKTSGATYTAPANGVVQLHKICATNTFISLAKTGKSDLAWGNGSPCAIQLEVLRGETYTLDYTATGDTNSFIFQYNKGNGSLYYYVGETVQNANLIDAGRVAETKADKKEVDGQWVEKYLNLNTSTAIGTYTIDLSDYLPKDGYKYEVFLSLEQTSSGSTASSTNIVSDIITNHIYIGLTSASTYDCRNAFSIPVGTGRYLKKEIKSAASTSCVLTAFAYRRLGTNV